MLSLSKIIQSLYISLSNFRSLLTSTNNGKYIRIKGSNSFEATTLFLKCGAADTDGDCSATKSNPLHDLRKLQDDLPRNTYLFNPDTKHLFYYELPGSYTKIV